MLYTLCAIKPPLLRVMVYNISPWEMLYVMLCVMVHGRRDGTWMRVLLVALCSYFERIPVSTGCTTNFVDIFSILSRNFR